VILDNVEAPIPQVVWFTPLHLGSEPTGLASFTLRSAGTNGPGLPKCKKHACETEGVRQEPCQKRATLPSGKRKNMMEYQNIIEFHRISSSKRLATLWLAREEPSPLGSPLFLQFVQSRWHSMTLRRLGHSIWTRQICGKRIKLLALQGPCKQI